MGFNVMPVRVGPNGLISDHALPLVDLDNRLGPGPVWVTSQHVLEREWKTSLAMDFLAQLMVVILNGQSFHHVLRDVMVIKETESEDDFA